MEATEDLVRIDEHPSRGKILVATKRLHAGRTILHEKPVIIVPDSGNPDVRIPGLLLDAVHQYTAFLSAPAEVQAEVLSFYSPVDGSRANALRAAASRIYSQVMPEDEVEVLVKVAMAFEFNGAGVNPAPKDGSSGEPPSMGVGLFNTACRAAHSCLPNCFW